MNFPVTIDPNDPMPLYAQLEHGIRSLIARGKLREGDQLPTVRQLAVELAINANTVAKVYSELERDGVLASKRGVGTFITKPDPKEQAKDRKKEFAALAENFLTDSLGLGFSLEEVLHYISSHKKFIKKGD